MTVLVLVVPQSAFTILVQKIHHFQVSTTTLQFLAKTCIVWNGNTILLCSCSETDSTFPITSGTCSLRALTNIAFEKILSSPVLETSPLPSNTVIATASPEVFVYYKEIKLPPDWKGIDEYKICGKVVNINDTVMISKAIHIEGDCLTFYIKGILIDIKALKKLEFSSRTTVYVLSILWNKASPRTFRPAVLENRKI